MESNWATIRLTIHSSRRLRRGLTRVLGQMDRYQLDRDATLGERALGAVLVSILALSLGVASYYIWNAALRSAPADPIFLALSALSAVGCCLLFRSLYMTLKAPPVRPSRRALMIAAYTMMVLGGTGLIFALVLGASAPHFYASAIAAVAMGARYIFSQGRRSGPN